MPDKSLIDFIAAQQAIGAHIEKIRSDLKTGDWTDADIDEALAFIEVRHQKGIAFRKTLKKIILIVFGVVFILGGTYITLTVMGRDVPIVPEKKPDPITFPDFSEKPAEIAE